MNLTDLQSSNSSDNLAKILKKHFNITVPIDSMSMSKIVKLHEGISSKLDNFRNTSNLYLSEKNKDYMSLLLIEQILRTKLTEGLITDIGRGISTVANAVKSNVPGANVQSPVQHGSVTDHIKNAASSLGNKISNLSYNYSDKSSPDFKSKSLYSPYEKEQAAERAGVSEADRLRIQKLLLNKKVLSSEDENKYNLIDKELKKMKKFDPSILEARYRKLTESSMADAEVILAAKDLVDRIQDMVETLGKMVNSELPAIGESIRDVMTTEQSEAYVTSATSIINSALENIRNTKDELDKSTQVLAGEEAVPDLNDEVDDMDMGDIDTDFDMDEPIVPKKKAGPVVRKRR
jgi:hypothetical protein